jgi:riboflavin biosynthesis pyrimidine reductase
MIEPPLTQLFPATGEQLPLTGLYLQHQLHLQGKAGKPFVYSNFVTSLDGRIALGNPGSKTHTVPAAIANARDWRLYQELAGQADLIVSSGRYFRQSEIGEEQDRLPIGNNAAFTDIHAWRQAQGLRAQPDIAILSGSLDIPVDTIKPYATRRIFIFTGDDSDQQRASALQAAGAEVIRAGSGTRVDGSRMLRELAALDYRSIYAIAGPSVFYTLLEAKAINRLYLTITQQLLGGTEFDTLTQGPLLSPAPGMSLLSLYHDPHAPEHAGQLLAAFESRDSATGS